MLGVRGATPPGARYAILAASPGTTALRVATSIPAAVAANNFAGVEDNGWFSVSPNAKAFVLCSYPRPGARIAELTVATNGERVTIHRATVSTALRVDGVQCVGSNSGTGMMIAYTQENRPYLVSIGSGDRPKIAHHRIEAASGLSMSPSGRQVFTQDGKTGKPLIIDLASGHVTSFSSPPGWPQVCCGGSGLNSGQASFSPDNERAGNSSVIGGLLPWATPDAIIARPDRRVGTGFSNGNRELVLNPRTRKWYVGPRGLLFDTFCPLPNGKVLFARHRERSVSVYTVKLYLFDSARGTLSVINSDPIGTIHAISCNADGAWVYLSVGPYPDTVYAASDLAIDGSAWTK